MKQAIRGEGFFLREAEFVSQHDGAPGKGIGKGPVVVQEGLGDLVQGQPDLQITINILLKRGQGGPVRLRQDRIETDVCCTQFSDLPEEPGNAVAGPGPLAVLGQALFIDVHDDRGPRRIEGPLGG